MYYPSYQIFFSHSFHDAGDKNNKEDAPSTHGFQLLDDIKNIVEKENKNIDIIYDKYIGDESIKDEVFRAIRESNAAFFFLNNKSLSSRWVEEEYRFCCTLIERKQFEVYIVILEPNNDANLDEFAKKFLIRDPRENKSIKAKGLRSDPLNMSVGFDINCIKGEDYKLAVKEVSDKILQLFENVKRDKLFPNKVITSNKLNEILNKRVLLGYSNQLKGILGVDLLTLRDPSLTVADVLFESDLSIFDQFVKILKEPIKRNYPRESLISILESIFCKWSFPDAADLREAVWEKKDRVFCLVYSFISCRNAYKDFSLAAFPGEGRLVIEYELNKNTWSEDLRNIKSLVIEKVLKIKQNDDHFTDSLSKAKGRMDRYFNRKLSIYILVLRFIMYETKTEKIIKELNKEFPSLIIILMVGEGQEKLNIANYFSLGLNIDYNDINNKLVIYEDSEDHCIQIYQIT